MFNLLSKMCLTALIAVMLAYCSTSEPEIKHWFDGGMDAAVNASVGGDHG